MKGANQSNFGLGTFVIYLHIKTMKTSDFTIGQELFYVPNGNIGGSKKPKVHVVKASGRKWVTAGIPGATTWDDQRFDPETMFADGGKYAAPGRYYMSQKEYVECCDADEAWRELREFIIYGKRPKLLKAFAIRAILKTLQTYS